MEITKFNSLPDDVLAQIFGFLPVGDLLNGIWSLNKRSHQVLRHPLTRVWLLSYATTWNYAVSSLDPKLDWFSAAVGRLRLDLAQLDPLEPFSSYVNKQIEILGPLNDSASIGRKRILAQQLQAAFHNRRWAAAVKANLDPLFSKYILAPNHISNPSGYEIVKENFADRRSWYVVSTSEFRLVSQVSAVNRTRRANFVVYSLRGEPLRFQYWHYWHDGDSGAGFDHERYMGLYFEYQGIFDVKVNGYSASTMLKAKCALLGLDPALPLDVQKAAQVSNQVILAFLTTIGIFSASWPCVYPKREIRFFVPFLIENRFSYRPDPLWEYELNRPLQDAFDMMAGARNNLRDDADDFFPPVDEWPEFSRATLPSEIVYTDLLKFVTAVPVAPSKERFSFSAHSALKDELDSDEIPRSTTYPSLPLHVQGWRRGGETPFDRVVQAARSQLMLHSHLNDWFSFASETSNTEEIMELNPEKPSSAPVKIKDNAGLVQMRKFLQESEIVVSDANRHLERDRGLATRVARTEFLLRPKTGSQRQYAPTTFVFKFSVCQSNWDEYHSPETIKLSVFEDSNYDVFSFARTVTKQTRKDTGPTRKPTTTAGSIGESSYQSQKEAQMELLMFLFCILEGRAQAYRLLMLKKRLFQDQHAEISPEVLFGALTVIGMSCDCWRRDGVQIYRCHDNCVDLLSLLGRLFQLAMRDAIAAHSESLSMDLQKDSKYAPVTKAERARIQKDKQDAFEAESKKKEEARRAREEAIEHSKATKSDPLDLALIDSSGFFPMRGVTVKQVPCAPRQFLACKGHYLVDISVWPPKIEASDLCAVNAKLVRPNLTIATLRTDRRFSPDSIIKEERLFITDTLPFKADKIQPVDALLAELNSAIGATPSLCLNETSKLPIRGLVGGRILFGDKCRRGPVLPLLIETALGSMNFAPLEGVEEEVAPNLENPFRSQARMDQCRRISVVKMPTLNAPSGFYQDIIFTMVDIYAVKEGTNKAEKVAVFEQNGLSRPSIVRTPREDTHFFEYMDEKNGGHRRLFQLRWEQLFEIVWDPSKPLTLRYVHIFTKGFPGAINKGIVLNGVGLLITKSITAEDIACVLIRLPAPLESFAPEQVANVSAGAFFTTLTWPELGWSESSNTMQILWSESLQCLVTLSQCPTSPITKPESSTDPFIKWDYHCSKCRQHGLRGMAWIPKTPDSDFALCTKCYDDLDLDTRIDTAADLQLTDMNELMAQNVIPFVPQPGKTIATKLDIDHVLSKRWISFQAADIPLPVRSFVPRTYGPTTLKTFRILPAFSRGGTYVGPPSDVDLLSIVGAWESQPDLLPLSHLVKGWKRYDSVRDLLADNLGSIIFVCRTVQFGPRTEQKVTMFCFLDFVEKFSSDPQTIHVETAVPQSYSNKQIKLSDIVWLGVVDYDLDAASNTDRETFILDKTGF